MSYTALTARTTNSEVFIDYLTELFELLKTHEGIKSTEIMLLMDNASCHQSDGVLEYLNLNKVRYIFLPVYSPELAPVENFFAQLKKMMTEIYAAHVNLNSETSRNIIKNKIRLINKTRIRSIWEHFYEKISFLLLEAKR